MAPAPEIFSSCLSRITNRQLQSRHFPQHHLRYDTHVPVIFFGAESSPATTTRRSRERYRAHSRSHCPGATPADPSAASAGICSERASQISGFRRNMGLLARAIRQSCRSDWREWVPRRTVFRFPCARFQGRIRMNCRPSRSAAQRRTARWPSRAGWLAFYELHVFVQTCGSPALKLCSHLLQASKGTEKVEVSLPSGAVTETLLPSARSIPCAPGTYKVRVSCRCPMAPAYFKRSRCNSLTKPEAIIASSGLQCRECVPQLRECFEGVGVTEAM